MKKKLRIIAIIVLLSIASLVIYSILSQAERNIERSEASLQMSDFIEKEYEITEIWEREIEQRHISKQNYLYFKVKNEPFNFNVGFGLSDFDGERANTKQLLQQIPVGSNVSILANKKDLEYASDNSLLRRVSNFLSGSNNEVEIYKLTYNSRVIFEQDIHTPSFSNRSFADIAVKNFIILLFICAAFYGILNKFAERVDKKKQAAPNK